MPEAPYGRSNCWLTVILITPEEFGADREVAVKSIWKRRFKEMVYDRPNVCRWPRNWAKPA